MEQLDVVYKLGNGSRWNNAELRYSLRSLCNFKSLRNVFIVGDLPDWIDLKNTIYIQASDPCPNNKDFNLINKLILATIDDRLSEEFVNMSDDQVFLKECSYEDLKIPFINNEFSKFPPGVRLNRWQQRLDRTLNLLKENNQTFDCFEAHLPYLLNKKLFAKTIYQYDYTVGLCGNTLYYNTLKIKGKQVEKDTVVRLVEAIEDRNVLDNLCNGKSFLNYTDKGINNNLLLYLAKQFPVKSKYEI